VDKSDQLPSEICLDCLKALENAYNFRKKCQDVDKHFRSNAGKKIKIEILVDENQENIIFDNSTGEKVEHNDLDDVDHFDDIPNETEIKINSKPSLKKETTKVMKKRKKARKLKYDYWKICEVCGKHTRNLVSHLDMHSTGKPYSCNVCDKKFKFKSGLLIHKAVHDPTPRKTCEVCGKTFHALAQYRRHFVYHANERKFGCDTCGKRFNTLDILKVHNRTHTDERPFSCQECGKTFRTAGCVSRHKRIVHRNLKVQ
jgi:rubrerythrin